MRKRELERLTKLLTEKREELLKEMELLKEANLSKTAKDASGEHSSHTFHMADLGTDAIEREKAFMMAHKTGRLVYHIDEALKRIKDSTYGKCIKCGKNIGMERLLAVPHARFCIKCKEQEEVEKAKEVRRR